MKTFLTGPPVEPSAAARDSFAACRTTAKTLDLTQMKCISTDLPPTLAALAHPECVALPLAYVPAGVLRTDPHRVTAVYGPPLSSVLGELLQAA